MIVTKAKKLYGRTRAGRIIVWGGSSLNFCGKWQPTDLTELPEGKEVKFPSNRTLEKYNWESVAKTPCGCRVEPDGWCEHGNPSWLILAHLV